jgi:hypothetical protein
MELQKIILEKLTDHLLVKTFPVRYETWRFIILFTRNSTGPMNQVHNLLHHLS